MPRHLLSEHELSDNCDNTTSSLAYDPTTNQIYGINYTYTESYVVKVDPEKAKKWIAAGAQPTDTVKALFKKHGVL